MKMLIKNVVVNPKKGVVAVVADVNGKSTRGVAKCDAADQFDLVTGFSIAFTKLLMGMSYEELDEMIRLHAEFHVEKEEELDLSGDNVHDMILSFFNQELRKHGLMFKQINA